MKLDKELVYLFLITILIVNAFIGYPALINVGAISLSGFLTVLYFLTTNALLIYRSKYNKELISLISPFVILQIWMIISLFWYYPSITGFQNILSIGLFIGLTILSALYTIEYKNIITKILNNYLPIVIWIAIVLYVLGVLFPDIFHRAGRGGFGLYILLLGVTWYLSSSRYKGKRYYIYLMVIILVMSLSLSRLALAIAFILFPLSLWNSRSKLAIFKITLILLIMIGGFWLTITKIEVLSERFFEGDTSIVLAGIAINASGRMGMWDIVLTSYYNSPIIGNGAGSAGNIIDQQFGYEAGHPHSDYLRILHDYGIVGLFLWLLGFLRIFKNVYIYWQNSDSQSMQDAFYHMVSVLGIIALALAMSTDNILAYVWIMAPLGILVGNSIGLGIKRYGNAR